MKLVEPLAKSMQLVHFKLTVVVSSKIYYASKQHLKCMDFLLHSSWWDCLHILAWLMNSYSSVNWPPWSLCQQCELKGTWFRHRYIQGNWSAPPSFNWKTYMGEVDKSDHNVLCRYWITLFTTLLALLSYTHLFYHCTHVWQLPYHRKWFSW